MSERLMVPGEIVHEYRNIGAILGFGSTASGHLENRERRGGRIFLLNVPLGLAAFALAVLFFPDDRHDERPRPLDLTVPGFLAPAPVSFLYSMDHVARLYGQEILGASLVPYVRSARRKGDDALIDLRLLFRCRRSSCF